MSSRNHTWSSLLICNWYVEFRLHSMRTVYWFSNFSWRKRKRISLNVHGNTGSSTKTCYRKRIMSASFLQWRLDSKVIRRFRRFDLKTKLEITLLSFKLLRSSFLKFHLTVSYMGSRKAINPWRSLKAWMDFIRNSELHSHSSHETSPNSRIWATF